MPSDDRAVFVFGAMFTLSGVPFYERPAEGGLGGVEKTA
jgi:hypothetical protein